MSDSSGPKSGHLAPAHPALALLQSPGKGKIVSAAEAVRLIRNGDTVATGGFVGIGFPEGIAVALEELLGLPQNWGSATENGYAQARFPAEVESTWPGS
jgi:hypothetical protein